MIGKQPLDNGFRQDIDLAIPITTDDLLSSHIGFTVKLPVIEGEYNYNSLKIRYEYCKYRVERCKIRYR